MNGVMLRVGKVAQFTPLQNTVLGWEAAISPLPWTLS
jgi:hypothetical protein